MASEDASSFKVAFEESEQLRRDILSARSYHEAAQIAAQHGWNVTASELESLAAERVIPEGELSDLDLEHVSGGAGKGGAQSSGKEKEMSEMMSKIAKDRSDVSSDIVRNIR